MEIKLRETEKKIIAFWADGKSAAQIGDILHVTKNTVCGIIGRLRAKGVVIERRPGEGKPKKIPRPPKVASPTPPPPPPPPNAPETFGAITIYELDSRSCRWPTAGDSRDGSMRYCGAEALIDKPYCEAHTLKARGALRTREPGNHPQLLTKNGNLRVKID